MGFGWKEALAKVAPTVATMLGGPLAGIAVNMAAEALGVEPTQDAIAEAVTSGNPEVFVRLKEVESNLKVKLRELDIEESSLHVEDRKSARKRESDVGGIATPTLAVIIIIGFFGIIAYILLVGLSVSPAVASMIGMLVGMVSSKAEQVVNYYFGSSAGSKRKNDLIQKNIEDINKKGS